MNSETQIRKNFKSDEDKPVYTLGVASQLSEIPSHSIRQYVDKGLIIPFKLESNRHLFSQNDISRLKNIHVLIHDKGLNFAGIRALMAMTPCWALRKCPESERLSCNAYLENYDPCWEASKKGRMCRNENCRECDVYKCMSQDVDLKSVLRATI